LVNFMVILVYFSRFGNFYQAKSGNPGFNGRIYRRKKYFR
jgi:hypothetical protein